MVRLPRDAHIQWTSLPHLHQRDEAIIRYAATGTTINVRLAVCIEANKLFLDAHLDMVKGVHGLHETACDLIRCCRPPRRSNHRLGLPTWEYSPWMRCPKGVNRHCRNCRSSSRHTPHSPTVKNQPLGATVFRPELWLKPRP